MTAIISGPDFLKEINQALEQLNRDIKYKKIDRDIDIINEFDKLSNLYLNEIILDISCVEDYRKVPRAIRMLKETNSNIRIIILTPKNFRANDIISNLISMEIYDIIGQREHEVNTILPSLLEHLETPATYSKAVSWNNSVKRHNDEYEATNEWLENKQAVNKVQQTIEKDKIIGTVIISVAGAMNRVGTTHTAISLAKFLIENRHGVAIVEMHESENFEFIKNSYENVEVKKDMFSLAGIDFYPYAPHLKVSDLLIEGYSYIILDMGRYIKCDKEEFKRAHERIIVSGAKDWELKKLEHILEQNDTINKNKYFFTFTDDNMFGFVKKNMDNLLCFKAPYNPNPLEDSIECNKAFNTLLKSVLPQTDEGDEESGFLKTIMKKKK